MRTSTSCIFENCCVPLRVAVFLQSGVSVPHAASRNSQQNRFVCRTGQFGQSRAVLTADKQICDLPASAAGQQSLHVDIEWPPACSCAASSQLLSCKACTGTCRARATCLVSCLNDRMPVTTHLHHEWIHMWITGCNHRAALMFEAGQTCEL